MMTPFPGMDPYLEGHLWPDVHQELSAAIKALLVPQISPNYVARLNLYTVEDPCPEEEIGIMYPDIEVLHRRVEEAAASYRQDSDIVTPATLTLDLMPPLEVRIPVVEIRDRRHNRLITAIEVLSPANKRGINLEAYRRKRLRLHQAGVHLLEIDLIRRGERPIKHPHLPVSHYLALLTRARASNTQVWAFNIFDPLPVLPVPLRAPDPDAVLDLHKALNAIYARSQYNLSIDYQDDPPPPLLSEADRAWIRALVK